MDTTISFFAALRDRIARLNGGRAEKSPVTYDLPPVPRSGWDGTIGCTNAQAFHTVCRMLHEKHGRKTPTWPEGTLNRLFKKHLTTHHPALAEGAPELTSENCWITRETRPKLQFVGLSRRLESGPRITADGGHPIVIARYHGLDCLLDGNRRCRYWYHNADTGLHDAYVLLVRNLESQ